MESNGIQAHDLRKFPVKPFKSLYLKYKIDE